jgi:hypothetical protein
LKNVAKFIGACAIVAAFIIAAELALHATCHAPNVYLCHF